MMRVEENGRGPQLTVRAADWDTLPLRGRSGHAAVRLAGACRALTLTPLPLLAVHIFNVIEAAATPSYTGTAAQKSSKNLEN